MTTKSQRDDGLCVVLKTIEAKTKRRGLVYRLEHEAKDKTFARVIIAYPDKSESAVLASLIGEINDYIYGILEIQYINDSAIIDLQGVGGVRINTYQNLLFGVLSDLLNAGLCARVDGYLLTPDMVQNAVNPKVEHPKKRERKASAKKLRQDGLTIEEIAERLDVSEATIKRDLKEKLLRLASTPMTRK